MLKVDYRKMNEEINKIVKQLKELKEQRELRGESQPTLCVPVMTREDDYYDEDHHEPIEKSEYDEWREDDYARRYREWESDQRRPY